MSRLVLLLKRLLVLLLGLGLVWFVVFTFYPFVDERLPVALALLVSYCFLAYVGLPALGRIWHILHKPTHVPTRTISPDGWALDPINIVVLSRSRSDLVRAMKRAGWLVADLPTIRNNIKFAASMVFNFPYPTAPFSTQFLFGRRQDLGFQIPISRSPRKRHHVRFWRLGQAILQDQHNHQGFWRSLLKQFARKKRQIWVGAAVIDWGLVVHKRTMRIDHAIDSDTTLERDYLVATLKDAGVLKDYTSIKAGEPLHTSHQGFREKIIADGYVKLCELKYIPPDNSTSSTRQRQ